MSRQQPSVFHFVVAVTIPDYGWTLTEGQTLTDATERMQIMTEFGRAMGLNIDVEVVSSDDTVEVVRRAVTTASVPYDEVIVIDRARGGRRWLGEHVVDQLRRDPGLPLTRLAANPPMRQGKHFRRRSAEAALPRVPEANYTGPGGMMPNSKA